MYETNADPEELVECPYDDSHMIRVKRMPYHLMKCRLNSTKELAVCPFNARHEVPKPELRHHMANCPDKAVLEKDLAYEVSVQEGAFFKGCTDVPNYNAYSVEINENWDEDINPRPRIGVHPSFHDRIQYRDMTGYSSSQKKAFHRGLAPDPEEPAQEPAADDNNVKDKLPKNASEASRICETQNQEKPVLLPPSVFVYSPALAGIGRGSGVNLQQLNVVPPAQTQTLGIGHGTPPVSSALPNVSSPYAMMAQMSQQNRGVAALPLIPLQQNNNAFGEDLDNAFGEDLDKFLDQELATRSDVTPEKADRPVSAVVETLHSGSWAEQTADLPVLAGSNPDEYAAPEYVLTTQPRSVGRGLTGVPQQYQQNGMMGVGQPRFQMNGCGESQSAVVPTPGFTRPLVGIGRGLGATVNREVSVQEGAFFKGCTNVPNYNAYSVEMNENWDEDINPQPRIGVHPSFRDRIQYRDMTGYSSSQKKAFHCGLAPDPEEPAQEPAADDNNVKDKLPKKASEASRICETQNQEKPVLPPPSVFVYSPALAGIGRGRGVNLQQLNVGHGTPPVSSALPNVSSPYAMMAQMSQQNRGVAALPLIPLQQNNNAFGEDLDKFLDQELATRSDVTPEKADRPVSAVVETSHSGSWAEQTADLPVLAGSNPDEYAAPEYVLTTQPWSVGRGLTGVPQQYQQNGMMGVGQPWFQMNGCGESQSAVVPPPGFNRPLVGIGRGLGATINREVSVQEGTFFKGCTDVPNYNAYSVEMNENWEEDINPRPRIGVHPSFRDKIQYRDMTGYSSSQKKAFHRGLAPDPEEPAQEPAADDNNVKDKLPKNASEASRICETQNQEKPVLLPPSVFVYSPALAGIGRGSGVNLQQLNVVPPAQTQTLGIGHGTPPVSSALPNVSSPYAMMSQMSQQNRGVAALPLIPLQQNNNAFGEDLDNAFGEDLDKFLDQELATRSDVTPEKADRPVSAVVETLHSGSWAEQTADLPVLAGSNPDEYAAPEYVLTTQPRSVGRGLTGVPQQYQQNGMMGVGQPRFQMNGCGESQSAVVPTPGFTRPLVGIGRGLGATVNREVSVQEGTFFKGCTDVPNYNAYSVEMNENWDEDINPRPRIGVHPSFRDRIQYRDMTGYSSSQKKAFHRGLAPDPEEPAQEPAADDNNVKDKLPKNASEASRICETQNQEKPVLLPPSVFVYSPALAGIGRGRGVNLQQLNVVPPAQTQTLGIGHGTPPVSSALPNVSSPYAMMAQMSQQNRGVAALPLIPLQQNNNAFGEDLDNAIGEDLDKFLDQELATRSDVTPEKADRPVSAVVETSHSGSWAEQTADLPVLAGSNPDEYAAPEYVLTTQPRSVGRGLTGVPQQYQQNGMMGVGQPRFQMNGCGESQSAVVPTPGFTRPLVGIGRGLGATVNRDGASNSEFVVPMVKQASKTHAAIFNNNNNVNVLNVNLQQLNGVPPAQTQTLGIGRGTPPVSSALPNVSSPYAMMAQMSQQNRGVAALPLIPLQQNNNAFGEDLDEFLDQELATRSDVTPEKADRPMSAVVETSHSGSWAEQTADLPVLAGSNPDEYAAPEYVLTTQPRSVGRGLTGVPQQYQQNGMMGVVQPRFQMNGCGESQSVVVPPPVDIGRGLGATVNRDGASNSEFVVPMVKQASKTHAAIFNNNNVNVLNVNLQQLNGVPPAQTQTLGIGRGTPTVSSALPNVSSPYAMMAQMSQQNRGVAALPLIPLQQNNNAFGEDLDEFLDQELATRSDVTPEKADRPMSAVVETSHSGSWAEQTADLPVLAGSNPDEYAAPEYVLTTQPRSVGRGLTGVPQQYQQNGMMGVVQPRFQMNGCGESQSVVVPPPVDIGRGLGATVNRDGASNSEFVVPMVKQASKTHAAIFNNNNNVNVLNESVNLPDSDTSSCDSSNVHDCEDAKKQRKKIQKKMRQIENLEMKKKQGKELTPEEVRKGKQLVGHFLRSFVFQ